MSLLAEGQTLDGTYQLLRLIGEGGMGEVYEATHARLAGRYAIKVLQRDLTQNPEAVARFDREARVTSLLQHPNVVQVIDHNKSPDGTEYLVMEYLDGESLAQRVARAGLPPLPELLSIVDQIAAGLAAAHAHGIVHRDLKPDNVFLVHVEGREGPLVKLLDFGISKVRGGAQTQNNQICGTPQYMAPEQVEARTADIGGGTDQFALAVIAYELLTGTNPFIASNLAFIFEKVLRGVPPPTGLGRRVDEVLLRGMAKSHLNRYPSVTDFAEALRAALLPAKRVAPVMLTAVPAQVAAGDPLRLRPRRSRVPLVVLALGGVVALFVYAGGAGGRLPTRPVPQAASPVSASVAQAVSSAPAAPVTVPLPAPLPPAPVAVADTEAPAERAPGAMRSAPPRRVAAATGDRRVSSAMGPARGRELPPSRPAVVPPPRPHVIPAAAPRVVKSSPRDNPAPSPVLPLDDDVMPLSDTFDDR